MAEYVREVPRYPLGIERKRILLRRRDQRVFLRSGSGHLPAHPQLLPDRKASLSEARMPHQLRRRASFLRHRPRRDRRLLLRRLQGPETGERRANHGRQDERKQRGQLTGSR